MPRLLWLSDNPRRDGFAADGAMVLLERGAHWLWRVDLTYDDAEDEDAIADGIAATKAEAIKRGRGRGICGAVMRAGNPARRR